MCDDTDKNTRPEPLLVDVLHETELISFEERLCIDLQLTRLDHFEHVTDDELRSQGGLSLPSIRRLRQAIDKRKKKRRGFIGSMIRKGEKDPRPSIMKQSEINRQSLENEADSNTITCLITKDQIKLMEKLGEGSFAEVRRAIWTQPHAGKKDVAVKLLRDKDLSEEVQQEVDNMHHLKHHNLIRLFGVVFTRPIMMVVELCEGGSLIDRMRSTSKPTLLATQLCAFAVHVAKGMEYLERKRFIHRDLACRNVLLTKDEKKAKIGDFGLMRALPDKDEHYIMSVQKKVPFAWCPPESLRRRQFSHASDVWSYGVTLWEMFTYGEEPWMGYRGPEILQRVTDGERLEKPPACPPFLYSVMQKCWSFDPADRPKFLILTDVVKEFQLSIGECKESIPGNGFMNCKAGERIIVIEDGYGDIYAQNARTGEYGRLRKECIALVSCGKKSNISGPLAGSLIHTGHGDARGGTSWGHPDKIDHIFLKNPMPLLEFDSSPSNTIRIGAEVVLSIDDAKRRSNPTPLRPPPPNTKPSRVKSSTQLSSTHLNSTQNGTNSDVVSLGSYSVGSTETNDEVDPFAPFDSYSMLYGAPPSDNPGPSNLYYSPVAQIYDTSNICPPMQQTTSSSIPEDPITLNRDNHDVYNAVRRLDNVNNQVIPPTPIQPHTTPIQPHHSPLLPQPTPTPIQPPEFRLPYTHMVNHPSHISTHVPVVPHPTPTQQQSSQQRLPTTTPLKNSPIYTPTPVPQSTPINPPPTPIPVIHVPNCGAYIPHAPTSTNYISRNCGPNGNDGCGVPHRVAIPSLNYVTHTRADSEPDPFEVSKEVKALANRPRYSEYYHGAGPPLVSPSVSSPPVFSPASTNFVPPGPLMSSGVHPNIQQTTSQINRLKSSVATVACASVVPLTNHSVSTLPKPVTLTPTYSGSRTISVPDITPAPDKAVLDLFDPLSGKPNVDSVKLVQSSAPFASVDRCSRMLHRCKGDVQLAIKQLKTEKLVDMAIAKDQTSAARALEKAGWDMNNAAAVLLG